MENLKLYIKESYNELINKVTWPQWGHLYNTTIVVLVGSLMLAVVIAMMDGVSNLVMKAIYGI